MFSVLSTRLKNGERHANFSAAVLPGCPRLLGRFSDRLAKHEHRR